MEFLPWAELWYNLSFHHSLGTTPFQAVYRWPTPDIIDYKTGSSNVEVVDVLLQLWDNMLHELRNNLLATQNRMKKYADLCRWSFEFKEGEWVWLRLQPYCQNSMNHHSCNKLAKRFYGPFQVEDKISVVAYQKGALSTLCFISGSLNHSRENPLKQSSTPYHR